MKRAKLVAALSGTILVLAACGTDNSGSTPATSTSAPESAETITVFGAASLKATFTELGAQFEGMHPGATVDFNFAGSSDLVAQITQGAPADVFASADTANMDKAVAADTVSGAPANFATNILTIVTEPGNPKGIASFADLARTDLNVVVCAPQVPCGNATGRIETATGVDITPVSEESSVTDVLGKVTSGQADAGLVYVTDATTAGDKVTAVPFPESADAVNTYPIAVLENSQNPELATKFVTFITGDEARPVFEAAGFGAP
ncbi:MAG: molybdate ABC transporter substrate-binding protein [Rhodococcus sp. (in: high G+C Gram-positive bacteria)]|uniref:molybdate ABC transporter substrate-binding protein n=1 Tax=Rhodococcus sp. TaxID=1831 RepID=UPI003BB68627